MCVCVCVCFAKYLGLSGNYLRVEVVQDILCVCFFCQVSRSFWQLFESNIHLVKNLTYFSLNRKIFKGIVQKEMLDTFKRGGEKERPSILVVSQYGAIINL